MLMVASSIHLHTPIVTLLNELIEVIIPFNPIHTSESFAYLRIIFDCKDNAFFCFLKIYSAIFPEILKI